MTVASPDDGCQVEGLAFEANMKKSPALNGSARVFSFVAAAL